MPRQGRFLLIFGRQNVAANGLPCGQYADFGARLTRASQRPMGRGAGAWGLLEGVAYRYPNTLRRRFFPISGAKVGDKLVA